MKVIELDDNNLNSFGDFIGVVQSAMRPSITLFQDEIKCPPPDKQKYPTLHIIAYVDSCPSKRVLVDNGSNINIISSMVIERLKFAIQVLNAPTLIIRVFNNTLAMIMGIMILLVRVGVQETSTTFHVVKAEIQYNLLLGQPYIEYMESVPCALHRCMKYLNNSRVHCIIDDPNPFSVTLLFPHGSSQNPCVCIFLVTILMNDHPNSTSSYS